MLSLIIPAFNESGSIAQTVMQASAELSLFLEAYEIIVVDDGSQDSTGKEAANVGATVIRHPQNIGYGAALKSGIRHAKYDTCAIIDADLTYPPEQIESLYKMFLEGYDMVVGARTGKHYTESVKKRVLRNILKFIVEFTAGRKIPDINSGMRVFKKCVALQFSQRLCDTFSFTTSLTLACMMNGKFVGYVNVDYRERAGETKVRLLKDSLRTLEYIVAAANYYDPIKLFGMFSCICVFLSLVGFIGSMFLGINAGYFLGLGGLLVAIIVFAMGMLASLLKQVMDGRH